MRAASARTIAMLNRIAATLRQWRKPPYQHPQLVKARAQCNAEIVRLIRDIEQLRREIHTHTDVPTLTKLHAAVANFRQIFLKRRRGD